MPTVARSSAAQLDKQPVYDLKFYDRIELPPQKDDRYLEGAPLVKKTKDGRKIRVICAGAG